MKGAFGGRTTSLFLCPQLFLRDVLVVGENRSHLSDLRCATESPILLHPSTPLTKRRTLMKNCAVLLCLAFSTLLSGCVAHDAADEMQKRMQARAHLRALEPTYVAKYDVSLIEVQRPADAQAGFGGIKTSQVDTGKGRLFQAEDQLLRIIWNGPDVQLGFDLLNKADIPVKVVWDEAAYVDIGGQTHRVIHDGVKLTDRNSPQPPSVIPSKGRLNDMVYPRDNVSYSNSRYKWRLVADADVSLYAGYGVSRSFKKACRCPQ